MLGGLARQGFADSLGELGVPIKGCYLRRMVIRCQYEPVDGFRSVGLAGTQDGRGELRLVGGIWKVLGFEAQSLATPAGAAVFARESAVQGIAGIKLQTRLTGIHLQQPAAVFMVDRGLPFDPPVIGVEDPVVIVAADPFQLHVAAIDPFLDGGWLAKVQGGVGDRGDFAGGNEIRIDR